MSPAIYQKKKLYAMLILFFLFISYCKSLLEWSIFFIINVKFILKTCFIYQVQLNL